MYNLDRISKLSQEVAIYEIYLVYGHGVVESPLENGPVVATKECTEIEAWIIAEAKNIDLWGTSSKRSSWASPTFSYRKIK